MPALPWRTFLASEPGREYLALLSFLPLKRFRTVPRFIWLTFETQRQLSKSGGLIGYSLLAQPLRRTFWTLSVWQDQQALMAFVRQIPHSRIMQSLAPHMGQTQFVQWKLPATAIPPSWKEAIARLT
jgi:hypothetical protein